MAQVAIATDPAPGRYGFPGGHPFSPARLGAFLSLAEQEGLLADAQQIPVREASSDELARFHTRDYIAFVRRMDEKGEGFLDHGDTPAFRGVYAAAARVVGAVLEAILGLLEGRWRRAFVPIAGLHHARRDGASGFCVFNDIGVAIETLKAQGVAPIAYLDIDAHHGDGVFYAFEGDTEVWIADWHEDGRFLFPGTGFAEEQGRGAARGTKRNFVLEPGATDEDFWRFWPEAEALIARAKPRFFILQCGADSIAGDPLTHLRLTPAVHAEVARRVRIWADRYAEGRLLALGGGGYDLRNLAEAWCGVVRAWI